MDLALRLPHEFEEAEFLRASAAAAVDLPTFLHGYRASMTFSEYIALLVTCDDDNIGSIRTIEKNGGILVDLVASAEDGRAIRRYWIDTENRSA